MRKKNLVPAKIAFASINHFTRLGLILYRTWARPHALYNFRSHRILHTSTTHFLNVSPFTLRTVLHLVGQILYEYMWSKSVKGMYCLNTYTRSRASYPVDKISMIRGIRYLCIMCDCETRMQL